MPGYVHPRYPIVQKAKGNAAMKFIAIAVEYKLTYSEALEILNHISADYINMLKTYERHGINLKGLNADEADEFEEEEKS